MVHKVHDTGTDQPPKKLLLAHSVDYWTERDRSVTEKIIHSTLCGFYGGVLGSVLGCLAPVWVPMGVFATVAVGGDTAYSYITQTGVADEVGEQSDSG